MERSREEAGDSGNTHCGRFVWRIKEFAAFLDKMRSCNSFVLYSKAISTVLQNILKLVHTFISLKHIQYLIQTLYTVTFLKLIR